MLEMSDIEEIKKLIDDYKLSFSEVSRITGWDRRTIKKWYYSKSYPSYQRSTQPQPVKDRIIVYIKRWIEEDNESIRKGKIRKIRTAAKMYDDLVSLGIECSERSVRKYVNELKPQEVFIEQEYFPAQDMQVDWGSLNIDFENGINTKVNLFVATLPYSNTRFVVPYIKTDSLSFFDGHIKAFEFFGGVPKRIRYDNLSSAVTKVLKGPNREETNKMKYFKSFFNFESNYCNIAKGNEKGSVENAVGFVKRRLLSGNLIFKDYNDLKKYLFTKCRDELNKSHYRKKKLIKELLTEEILKFKPIPLERFDNSQKTPGKVSNTLMIHYDGVRYSVPDKYCRKSVIIKADTEYIEIYYQEKLIAKHKRTYSVFNKEVYDFRHYLPVLFVKSRALTNAKCIIRSNFPSIFWKYLDGLNSRLENGNREMVKILLLHKKYDIDNIFFSMEWCYEHRSYSYDAILVTLKEITVSKSKVEKINKTYPETQDMPLDLKKYDKLIGV